MSKISIIGVFSDEEQLVTMLHHLKEKKIDIREVYTPYPVHHVFEILERKSRFFWAAFLYGLFAVIGVLSFLYYTAVIDWPLNFGGKPTNAFPSFIVITLVLTILSITILSLFTFSIRAKIFPFKTAKMPDLRATDDKFVVVLDRDGQPLDASTLMKVLQENGADEVYEKSYDTF
jgi:hypothetical protein